MVVACQGRPNRWCCRSPLKRRGVCAFLSTVRRHEAATILRGEADSVVENV